MFEKIFHLLTGFVIIHISGKDAYRFINLCMKTGIRFWGYKPYNDGYKVCLKFKEYKSLRQIKKKCDVKIKLIKKRGLRLKFKFIKKRPGLVLGFITSIFLYIFLLSRVWSVNVEGAGVHTSDEILEYAKSIGVYVGAARSSFEERDATRHLLMELDNLEWASVNTYGSTVTISVNHKEEKPEIINTNDDTVQNIVASKAGIIKSIEAQAGRVFVDVGDTVYEGELLVSGVWDSNEGKEEWAKTDIVNIFMVKARAQVIAQTEKVFTASIPKIQTNYEKGKVVTQNILSFFSLDLPLGPLLVKSGEYTFSQEEKALYLLGTKMPISIYQNSYTKLYPYKTVLSLHESEKILQEMIEDEILSSDIEILSSSDINVQQNGDFFEAHVTVTCLENIAKEQLVYIK